MAEAEKAGLDVPHISEMVVLRSNPHGNRPETSSSYPTRCGFTFGCLDPYTFEREG